MKIAHIAPLHETVPPATYGGTERIVANLVDGLVDLGHEVTLFAADGSKTKAELVVSREQALRLDPHPLKSEIAAHLSMLDEARRRAGEFDILHFHLSHFLHFPFFEDMPEKTVTTPHGRLDYQDLAGAYRRWPSFPMISISHRQQRPLPQANWVASIHHGIPLDIYAPRLAPGGPDSGYLAFLGRISRDKRPDRAIEIARRTGMKLKIAAKIGDDDRAYYHEVIEPLIAGGNDIEFVGEIGEADKADFLGNAAALLFPIDWPEPFGLVVIEAMACGTPVVAWNEGAMREIIDDGITGLVVGSLDEAVAAVATVRELDRRRVREKFESRFSAARMARDYADVYVRLAERQPLKAATGF